MGVGFVVTCFFECPVWLGHVARDPHGQLLHFARFLAGFCASGNGFPYIPHMAV